MANSILWKDISCEEVGELLLTTEIQECKNRLYDNLSLSKLFSPPEIYNRQGSTDGAASSESMILLKRKIQCGLQLVVKWKQKSPSKLKRKQL